MNIFELIVFVSFLQELPAPILDDVAVHATVEQPRLSCDAQESLDAMKIAWRYQNLPKVQVITIHLTKYIVCFYYAVY